jgi:hypothetical protein
MTSVSQLVNQVPKDTDTIYGIDWVAVLNSDSNEHNPDSPCALTVDLLGNESTKFKANWGKLATTHK